ncbi:MAG: ABC transporter substrate-binding protein [Chloroflexi bacterium]|nr:MAG: ABC transporter substrate-binding protein [Chloroflexota bacterium]
MIYIGIDDTDMLDTRGTGHLARQIAAELATDYSLLGVTRHQLSSDPRVPCTHKNSSAVIHLDAPADAVQQIMKRVEKLMHNEFVPGSDPGLCVTAVVPKAITQFGLKAKKTFVFQSEARVLANAHGLLLKGLGGTEDGVIGALAAVGLAAGGSDGRYIIVGRVRDLAGLQPVDALLQAGVMAVQTSDGTPVHDGMVLTDKVRPARRNGRPVAIVQWQGDHWLPLKLD